MSIVCICCRNRGNALFAGVRRMRCAEEGGSGHYFPGSMSDFTDTVPPTPTFIVRYNQIYYSGAVGANKPIPIAGTTALGLSRYFVGRRADLGLAT